VITKITLLLLFLSNTLNATSSTTVQSRYTNLVDQITLPQLNEMKSRFHSTESNKKIFLTCIETSDDHLYIGLWHGLEINTALKNVTTVIEDFNNYHDFFEGIEESKIQKKVALNQWEVLFENKSPVFFVPNVHYQMNYIVNPLDGGVIYKYHLSNLFQQKSITFSDGMIFLKEENGITKFYELDFFNANWGILGTIAGANVWNDSVKELVISDLELKFKSENLKLTTTEKKGKIESSLKGITEDQSISKCINTKVNEKAFFGK
jgi:hypothetical protein